MVQAIESLRERIRANVEILKAFPGDDRIKHDIYVMVSAVNVMEMYEYGSHVTKYNDIIEGESK